MSVDKRDYLRRKLSNCPRSNNSAPLLSYEVVCRANCGTYTQNQMVNPFSVHVKSKFC